MLRDEVAAWLKAEAMLTEVSLTTQPVGLGGEVKVLGAPGREEVFVFVAASRCLRRAKRASAGSFS